MKKYLSIAIISVSFFGIILISNSCKQPKPPKAVVYVVDDNNVPVSNARVIVKAPTSNSGHQTVVYLEEGDKHIADTQLTNEEGKINYSFRYRAIYRVEVIKEKDNKHPQTRRGLGVLMLEDDKTIETTIRINEQTTF
ncbi:MAG: hypothetical protein LBV69_04995 [Bacteroidales bacterium]|nr:hypothetical protein [Bacteroidales bacterium]